MSMEILTPNAQQLSGRKDFIHSIKIVARALKGCPAETLTYVALTIIEEIYPSFRLLGALESIVLIYLSRKVVQTAYLEFIDAANATTKLPPAPIKRLLGLEIVWSLCTTILGLCLIIPGVWFATSAALAQQFVIIEDAKAIESLSRSKKLVTGHFWKLLIYAGLWPAIAAVIALIVMVVPMSFVIVLLPIEIQLLTIQLERAITVAYVLVLVYTFLCSTALATRMFAHLMRKSGTQTLVEKLIAAQSLPTA